PDSRAQQAVGIDGVRRHHHSNPGRVGKINLAGLAMINGSAFQVAAGGDANHHWALEGIIRAPADQRHFVPELMESRPDVIEELNLGDRFQPPLRHPKRSAYDVGLGQRRVEYSSAAEPSLKTKGDLENSALAL